MVWYVQRFDSSLIFLKAFWISVSEKAYFSNLVLLLGQIFWKTLLSKQIVVNDENISTCVKILCDSRMQTLRHVYKKSIASNQVELKIDYYFQHYGKSILSGILSLYFSQNITVFIKIWVMIVGNVKKEQFILIFKKLTGFKKLFCNFRFF